MANAPKDNKPVKKSMFSGIKRFFGSNVDTLTNEIDKDYKDSGFLVNDYYSYGSNTSYLENRAQQYSKIQELEGDGVISSAIGLMVTAALGGHETTGEVVFIEKKPNITPQQEAMLDDIKAQLEPLINRCIWSVCYEGATYGDMYTRIYAEDGKGVQSLLTNEITHPTRIVPYERGGLTVGYYLSGANALGNGRTKDNAKLVLNPFQMARFKMPRTSLSDEFSTISMVTAEKIVEEITTDKLSDLPVRPSRVGGSLITKAVQNAYENYAITLSGMTTQRLIDSMDESIITYTIDGDLQRREMFKKSLEDVFKKSKVFIDKIAFGTQGERNQALLARKRYLVPVSSDGRQSVSDAGVGGSKRAGGSTTIEDVMTNARLLSGALGVDLSLLGFADQMAGGLGEGGFFRTSAQVAERARIIRAAATDYIEQVIQAHIASKYGAFFDEKDKFWDVNFFGSIAALEAERRDTMNTSMMAGATMIQTLQQAKDIGMSENAMVLFLTRQMMVDEDLAKEYVKFEAPAQEGM